MSEKKDPAAEPKRVPTTESGYDKSKASKDKPERPPIQVRKRE